MHLVAALLALPLASAQLNELAQKAGKKYFGTATDSPELYSHATYFSILTDRKEFGQLTPANGQKWSYIEPQYNVFNYTEGEVVTNIARQNGQMLRCHNLVWHRQLPNWVMTTTSTWDKANMTAMLRQHVYNEASHWKGQCYAWDVVNEGLNKNGTYRDNSIFYQVLGEEYLKIAFEAAALADPSAKLYYNDYGIEAAGPKAEGAKRIVKLIKDAGLRIDGVGLQSHFTVGGTPSIDRQISNMQSFAELGVEVAITELDIRLNLLPPVTAANLAQQKRDYKTTVGACMQVEKCVGVTVWDFYDPSSWVPSVFPEQGAATLYFANFTKHPAYHGVVEAITNKTNRGEDVGKKNGKGKDGKAKEW
ncbi:glycoside hydrolase superfamily [Diplogelasinospora grovesii]|uniref:Beta-xylanase n=1 Tax=Diplogelasinospora grovesii TaxID=303347 RepID=A0AAN6S8P2_9PEZI|nr:glycoside hydrolase superfamily [Diplogelasinospora grovesii]